MSIGSFVAIVVAGLIGLAVAGSVPWEVPVTLGVAAALVGVIVERVRERRRCGGCGGVHRDLVQDQGERICDLCRAEATSDARLDDLVRRATATVEDLEFMDAEWPDQFEAEELEIRLRALGADVEVAWRAFLRSTEQQNKALESGRAEKEKEAMNGARRALIAAISSARSRRVSLAAAHRT